LASARKHELITVSADRIVKVLTAARTDVLPKKLVKISTICGSQWGRLRAEQEVREGTGEGCRSLSCGRVL